ncbi:uncharacterized protein LOC119383342 [Rhipicephalus sanguineus]|uniref:uncharacterized protein LOC119383342 n=1 Tax=Rhipicephalus sanguineus TaxID=34632 RepID=UPI0018942879|nr:uncharacterized protein LOC119383342 [Rhipicephalus sanguineus]
MASLQASIEPFSGKAWTSWIQRLGFYFVANSITADEKRRALLLTLCGPETFETVRALVAPKSPGEVPYEEIVQTLAAHYDPRPSELYCRCKFQRRDQQPGESIAVYVAALRKLAADCNFGVGALPAAEATATTAAATTALPLDIMLRDRFVCGIRNELVQQRLFAERDLTFQKAFDLAERAESAALQQKSIKLETEKLEVHKTSHKKGGAKGEQHTPRKAHCYRCDGSHDPDVISYEGPPVHIELDPNVPPRFCKARPVPLALRPAVKEELDRLEKQGILQPVQHSDWATPLVLVRKKSGLLRLCGDYRSTVNAAFLKAAYPLPTTEEVLSTLRGGRMFSTLDLFQAYQQLPVTENTAKVLTVNTMNGLYAVKRLPFGISAAPAIFQKIMETTLAGIPGTSVYLDDIIVCGETPEQHNERLDQVLSRLGNIGLRLQKDKCRFGDMNVEFLGHRIDEQDGQADNQQEVPTAGAPECCATPAPLPSDDTLQGPPQRPPRRRRPPDRYQDQW